MGVELLGVTVPEATVFSVLVAVPTLLLFLIGDELLLREFNLKQRFFRTDWKYLGGAWIVTYLVNTVAHQYHVQETFTGVIYAVEGSIVTVFQSVTWPALTWFMAAVYLVGFPFIVLFTFFKVHAAERDQAHRYAIAYASLALLALPWFVWFPVEVTSYWISSVEPILYTLHPAISEGIAATDTLQKAFPSLHAGLSFLALLYATKTEKLYVSLTAALTALIFFSTLYLGIHWISDLVFGSFLAVIAYKLSQMGPAPADVVEQLKNKLP